MTDGIPADVMEVVNSHVSNVFAIYQFGMTRLLNLHCSTTPIFVCLIFAVVR